LCLSESVCIIAWILLLALTKCNYSRPLINVVVKFSLVYKEVLIPYLQGASDFYSFNFLFLSIGFCEVYTQVVMSGCLIFIDGQHFR